MHKRQKIAVIGSGMSAMTAVYEITKTPHWREKYDITIYQMGWRIGGKGASGRNSEIAQRIEEHGLHIWFGFYTNAFNLMRDCYKELGPTMSPIKTFEDAFKPQSFIPIQENINGEWKAWYLDFPTNDLEPGGNSIYLPLWEYIRMTIEGLRNLLAHEGMKFFEEDNETLNKAKSILLNLGGQKAITYLIKEGDEILEKALRYITDAQDNIHDPLTEQHKGLLSQLDRFGVWFKNLFADLISRNTVLRRLFIIFDFCTTNIKGILVDDLIRRGLDAANNEEYRHWLQRHGAAKVTWDSALLRALYDVGFAYEKGNINLPNYEAGSAIRIVIRLALAYKGAFMWKMQAGMGDTIFTPIHTVLSRYHSSKDEGGVTFKFFHKAKNIVLSECQQFVEKIEMEEQATLKNPHEPYDPYVVVKDIPCWPSEPLYDQLVEGEELKANKINLESFWTTWKGKDITLQKGVDFDIVILGTPIGTLAHICPQIINTNERWATMIQKIKTTQTQAYQLWVKKSLKEMGWTKPSPVMTTYVEPVDTWADMSHLIPVEDFPEEYEPRSIAYFCGVFPDAEVIPPANVHIFPEQEHERVREGLEAYLNENMGYLWPKAAHPYNPKGLDLDLLVDMEERNGVDRINSQFWRANIDPNERYTLTNVGSSQYRLRTDETGYDNLYITGDWIQNNFNYGCIEACVMAGMMTARAVTGYDIEIIGEYDW